MKIIVIGASTGGPKALEEILFDLPTEIITHGVENQKAR